MFAAYSNIAYIINVAIRVNRLQMDRLRLFSFSSLKKKKKKIFLDWGNVKHYWFEGVRRGRRGGQSDWRNTVRKGGLRQH